MISESDISGYRNVLLRRAQQLPNCPDGKLIQRRGSRRNPVFTKLAEDFIYSYMEILATLAQSLANLKHQPAQNAIQRAKLN